MGPNEQQNRRYIPQGAEPQSLQTSSNNSTAAYPNTPNMAPSGNNYTGPTNLTPGGAPGAHRPEMGAAFYRHAAAHPGNVGAQYWIDRAGQAYENPLPQSGSQNNVWTDAYGNQRFDYNQSGANFGNATGQFNPGDLTHPDGLLGPGLGGGGPSGGGPVSSPGNINPNPLFPPRDRVPTIVASGKPFSPVNNEGYLQRPFSPVDNEGYKQGLGTGGPMQGPGRQPYVNPVVPTKISAGASTTAPSSGIRGTGTVRPRIG